MKKTPIGVCDRAIEVCLWLLLFCLPFAKAGVELFAWLGILFWILKRCFGYRTSGRFRLVPTTPLNKVIAAYLVVNALATIFSVDHALSTRALYCKTLKFVLIYFMVVETIVDKKRLRNICLVLMSSALLMIADAIVQYHSGVDFLRGHGWARLTVSFASANDFAAWLIIVIPIFSGILLTPSTQLFPRKIKWGLLMVTILLLLCLLFTYSRGAWFGILFATVLAIGYGITRVSVRQKMKTLLLVLGLIGVVAILPQSVKGKISEVEYLDSRSRETIMERLTLIQDSASIRGQLWHEAFSIVEDFPLLGTGLNTYSRVAPAYKVFDGGGGYPHNSFLQMTAETGLLGLGAFLWILVEFFKWGCRLLKRQTRTLVAGMLAGILAFLIQSFVDTNLYSLPLIVMFWFMLGLTVAANNVFAQVRTSTAR